MTALIFGLFLLITGTSVFLAYKKAKLKSTGPSDIETDVLQIKLPKASTDSEKTGAEAAERLFSNLHGLLGTQSDSSLETVSFEITGSDKGVLFYVAVPSSTRVFVESQLYAHFPNVQIEKVDDYLHKFDTTNYDVTLQSIKLSKSDFFPIKTFKTLEVDPLSSITETLSGLEKNELASIQITVRPLEDGWQQKGYDYINELKVGKNAGFLANVINALLVGFGNLFFGPPTDKSSSSSAEKKELSPSDQVNITNVEEKLLKMGYLTEIKLLTSFTKPSKTKTFFQSVLATFKQYSSAHLNGFVQASFTEKGSVAVSSFLKRHIYTKGFILNTEEIAGIFHFPGSFVSTPNISRASARKGEPPLNLPVDGDVTYFGTTNFRNKNTKFGIKNGTGDRLRHMYFVGKTGAGKSTMFEHMIIQDIKDGRGCCYIDPHGDTVEKILTRIPKERIKDVVLINPADIKNPPAINVLECPDPSQSNLLASSVLSAFKLQFGYSWGPRLEYLLNNALLTLVEIEGTTLLSVTRLLTDKNYRKYILEKVQDPVLLNFWNKEFVELEQSFGAEAVSPIQNKVNRLLASTTIRNVLGQRKSTIKFDEIMDTKKILLVNLSKGKIGDDNSNLLGALIVNRLMFHAMQRSGIDEKDRVPFYLFVDEFQNFATESFVTILSEARKYGLSLNLTHQYTAQLPIEIKDAILGNTGSMVAFTLGAQDAAVLKEEFAPTFDENDLISQEKFNFYCKVYIDGSTSKPFSGVGLPPKYVKENSYSDEIKDYTAKTYGRPKDYVEERIKVWMSRPFDAGLAIAEKYRQMEKANATQKK
jgi:hypothetical protein